MWYILDENNKPVQSPVVDCGDWLEENQEKRVVKQDNVGDVFISTVFLGLDHAWPRDNNIPLLWETMIFGGEHDQYMDRYTSYEDAVEGHQKALNLVNKSSDE